jgi:hypothetical protein
LTGLEQGGAGGQDVVDKQNGDRRAEMTFGPELKHALHFLLPFLATQVIESCGWTDPQQ